MKHKITNIREPENDIEVQKVENAKKFSSTVWALALGCLGSGATLSAFLVTDDYMFVLISVLNAICAMSMTPALLKDLMDFYKQKDIGYGENDNLSGGKQR